MTVYLVPKGGGRYDLEPAAATHDNHSPATGFWARRLDRLRARWTRAVQEAAERRPTGLWAKWRSRLISSIDESIEAQRALWALRDRATATLEHPPELTSDEAAAALRLLLADARRHHGRWFAGDSLLLAASGLLMPLPGPNLIAYYFGFRVIGHYLSWRGARQALDTVTWTFEPRS